MADNLQNKSILLIENQYFPCINWIKLLFQQIHIQITPFEQYRKMSFRNRCVVAGSNGLVSLSVPVENGRNQRVPFKEVRISYQEDWQTQHWRTLTACYNKSAFFEFYRDGLEVFFLKKEKFLFDLDTNIIFWLKSALRLNGSIAILADKKMDDAEGVLDLRDQWLPKNFQDGAHMGGEIAHPYFQVFENRIGFQPNLSVLDLLFNEGPNAHAWLHTNNL